MERTFSRGGWLKSRREVSESIANDELRAIHFPKDSVNELLGIVPLVLGKAVSLISHVWNFDLVHVK